ncbi:unnamed protein product [Somion occarium]|uniref:ATP phosphoribosyltransferase n=1 Tax=Somion occarium TaxID=3059160 RepID=A0ABP1DWR4_9APHY
MPRFKLVFFSPVASTSTILSQLFKKYPKTVGRIGQYEECAFFTGGHGLFRPGPEANPAIGSRGALEQVEEHRVEVLVTDKGENTEIKNAIEELKRVHPYEEVAYDVYRLEDF